MLISKWTAAPAPVVVTPLRMLMGYGLSWLLWLAILPWTTD